MSTFTAAALSTLIAAHNCVPPVVAPIVIGIAQHESGGDALAIHDNTAAVSFTPHSTGEAMRLARALIAHGHSVDLGIGQINDRNLSWTGLTIESVFDVCANLAASSKILFAKYNGSPPDAMKAAYAAGVNARIVSINATADDKAQPTPPEPESLRDALRDSDGLKDLLVHPKKPEPKTEEKNQ